MGAMWEIQMVRLLATMLTANKMALLKEKMRGEKMKEWWKGTQMVAWLGRRQLEIL